MISLDNVTHRYGNTVVLDSFTHTFPEKGIVALMGGSGIGKTTLLRLLCGLEKPSAGKVTCSYHRVAVSFQEPRLIPWLNCEENINFVLPREKKGSDIVKELLHLTELDGCRRMLPSELSGGMKQRLSLARALAVGADLLLLDEPFSALDADLKSRLIPLVAKANKEGLTIVVTHNADEAHALGATVYTLDGPPVTSLVAQ